MSDLRDLYQEVVLEHGKNPRNLRPMEDATAELQGYNPLCGDKILLYVRTEGDLVKDISFEGAGCAISMASASLLSETMVGKTKAEVDVVFESFHSMLTGSPDQPIDSEKLGKLAVFGGVCEYPMRVKCASLSWHTLKAILNDREDVVTTE